MTVIINLIAAFILTAVIEGISAYAMRHERRFIVCSILCNLLTNPALNIGITIVFNIWGYSAYIGALVLFEILAVAVEAAVYQKLCDVPFKKALVLSLILNGCSFLIGGSILFLINLL